MGKKQPKSRVDQMLDDLRKLLFQYGDIPEQALYEALMEEASGWEMRLEELQESEDTE